MHTFELFSLNERINVNHTHTLFLNSQHLFLFDLLFRPKEKLTLIYLFIFCIFLVYPSFLFHNVYVILYKF